MGNNVRELFSRAICPSGESEYFDHLREKRVTLVKGCAYAKKVFFDEMSKLRKGVTLDGVKTKRAKIKFKETEQGGKIFKYEMTIFEGKNRQIRRMFEAVGKNVVFLKRVAIGDLRLGGLGRGKTRYLSDFEVEYLKNL